MKKFICLLALLGLASASVQASTFNFAAYADADAGDTFIGTTFSNELNSVTTSNGNGEAGYDSYSVTNDGITVTATGSNSTGTKAYAYLDSGKAGLGVCSTGLNNTTLGDNQCATRSDDNVTDKESVILDFSRLVSIDGLRLVDANHITDFGGVFDINIDGGDTVVGGTTISNILLAATPGMALGLIGTIFEFVNVGGLQGDEFYINTISVSAVPVPAAGILFASALLGAGAFGRRKKKAKASVVGAFARAS